MSLFILIICTVFFLVLPMLYTKKRYNFWQETKKYIYAGLLLLTVLVAVTILIFCRVGLYKTLLLMAFSGIMYSVALIDFKTKTIDSWLMLSLLLVAMLSLISPDWVGSLFKIGTSIIVFGMMFLISKISKGVGFGDVQLFALVALLLDFDMFFATIFYGLIISLISGVILMKKSKSNMKYELPFAPFIEIGFILAMIVQAV